MVKIILVTGYLNRIPRGKGQVGKGKGDDKDEY